MPPKELTPFDKLLKGDQLGNAALAARQHERTHKSAGFIVFFAAVFCVTVYILERYVLHGSEDQCAATLQNVNCVVSSIHSATSIQWAETVLAGIFGGAGAMYFGQRAGH